MKSFFCWKISQLKLGESLARVGQKKHDKRISNVATWQDAMNRARIFVQEMFGHNERWAVLPVGGLVDL